MARNYREVNRDQPFLLPPDMRDWLPEDHLAWFLLDVIAELDTRVLHARSRKGGVGREGYDPDMLLGLWIYASARGISSSRQIERACVEDVAFRVLCGQDVPDHTVLARFRQRHQDAMADLFAQVLALCVRQGLGRFGVIAIDGTKIRANASPAKTVTVTRLRQIARDELDKAAAVDAAEDAANESHDDVPPGMGAGSDRRSRIRQALADVEQQIDAENLPLIERREQQVADAKAQLVAEERVVQERLTSPRRGPEPKPNPRALQRRRDAVAVAERRLAAAKQKHAAQLDGQNVESRSLPQRNITDPQSRLMRSRGGFVQGFNAQLAVTDDGLIVAADVTDQGNDQHQFEPMLRRTEQAVMRCQKVTGRRLEIGVVVADNGYLSDANVDLPGPDRLIAPGRGQPTDNGGWQGSTRNPNTRAATLMRAKLADPENLKRYRRRSVTVEPVNGHLKDRRGLRQFARRGLNAANAELLMAAMTTNLLKLFTNPAPGTA